jgi:hypothetical protein
MAGERKMADTGDFGKNEQVDLLMKKYGMVRQELMLYMSNYKSNVKYMNYVIIGLVAIFSLSVGKDRDLGLINSRLFWIFLGAAITTIVGYISYDLLESQYALKSLAARAVALEKTINRIVGKNLLMWESHLAGKFFAPALAVNGVWNPSFALNIYWGLFVAASLILPPSFIVWKFWNNISYSSQTTLFRAAVLVLCLYSAMTAVFISGCAFTIFLRLSPRAQELVQNTSREQEVEL